MEIEIFCVQPFMTASDYVSQTAFYQKISSYFLQADAMRHPQTPAIIVFPEDLATFLLLQGLPQDDLHTVSTIEEAFQLIGNSKRLAILKAMLKYHTTHLKRAFFTLAAHSLWQTWYGVMADLARQYRMTVVAGSGLIPDSKWPLSDDRYAPKSARVYNLSFTVNPDGQVIDSTKKVNLVPTQEDVLDLTPGPLQEAAKIVNLPHTTIPMGTAICYDAFTKSHTPHEPHFVSLLSHLDRLGARLVAQPSANPWWWDEPWPLDPIVPPRIRSQQWDEEGSYSALRHCQHVEVVVNPQLLLEFLDVHFDGQSRILVRDGRDVSILQAAHTTRGPSGDALLHASWDFSGDPQMVQNR